MKNLTKHVVTLGSTLAMVFVASAHEAQAQSLGEQYAAKLAAGAAKYAPTAAPPAAPKETFTLTCPVEADFTRTPRAGGATPAEDFTLNPAFHLRTGVTLLPSGVGPGVLRFKAPAAAAAVIAAATLNTLGVSMLSPGTVAGTNTLECKYSLPGATTLEQTLKFSIPDTFTYKVNAATHSVVFTAE